jgi:hypothetical protein
MIEMGTNLAFTRLQNAFPHIGETASPDRIFAFSLDLSGKVR